MNITDADREAAQGYLDDPAHATDRRGPRYLMEKAFAAHRLRGYNAGLEAAAALVESGMFNSHGRAQPALAAKLRAMIEGSDR